MAKQITNEDLAKKIDDLAGVVANLAGTVKDSQVTVNSLTGTVENLSGTVKDLTGKVENLSGTVKDSDVTVKNLSGTVKDSDVTVKNLAGTVTKLEGTIETSIENLAAMTQRGFTSMGEYVDKRFNQLETTLDDHGNRLNRVEYSIKDLRTEIANLTRLIEKSTNEAEIKELKKRVSWLEVQLAKGN